MNNEQMEIAIFGITKKEAIKLHICINCRQKPKFYSDAGFREYRISALCEPCFDKTTEEQDES